MNPSNDVNKSASSNKAPGSNNINKAVSTNKAPGYTKTVIGTKDMSSKTVSDPAKKSPEPGKASPDSAKASSAPANASSSSAPGDQSGESSQDPNPMSSTGFAKMAKKEGLPFTSPVRPTF